MPAIESVPVPPLPMVSVDSAVLPISTLPKARFPPSDTILVTDWAADDDASGVGAVGLAFSQAEAASARTSTPRQKERIIGHSNNDPHASNNQATGPERRAARIWGFRAGCPFLHRLSVPASVEFSRSLPKP
jgi:hypothetical protein